MVWNIFSTRIQHSLVSRRQSRLLRTKVFLVFVALVLLIWLYWKRASSRSLVTTGQLTLRGVGAGRQASFVRLLGDRETLLVGGVTPIHERMKSPPACRLSVVSARSGSQHTCRFVHETWESDHHDKPLTSFVWFFAVSPAVPEHATDVRVQFIQGEQVQVLPVALPALSGPQRFLSVCVPVLQNNADPDRVVEWLVRMSRRHGVTFVRMYLEANWRPSLVARLLERARKQRLPRIELLAMPNALPMHYFGQYLAIYDCWLREATASSWTLFMDLDEEVRILQPRPMALRFWLQHNQRHIEATAIAGFTLGSWLYLKKGIGLEPEMAQPRPVCLPPRRGWQPLNQVDAGGTLSSKPVEERCLGPPGRRKLLLQADKMRQIQIHKAYALSGYRIVDLNTSEAHIMHYRGYVRGQPARSLSNAR